MIKPIKCDRCGRPILYDDPHQQVLLAKYKGLHDRVIKQDFDLCEDCARALVAWVYEKQKKEYKTTGG